MTARRGTNCCGAPVRVAWENLIRQGRVVRGYEKPVHRCSQCGRVLTRSEAEATASDDPTESQA